MRHKNLKDVIVTSTHIKLTVGKKVKSQKY